MSHEDDLDSRPLSTDGIEVEELEGVDAEAALYAAACSRSADAHGLNVNTDNKSLTNHRIFNHVEPAVLEKIAKISQTVMLSPGQALIAAGQLNTKVYFLLEGQLRILAGKNQKKIVGVIDQGYTVGLRSAIDQKPCTVDFLASEPTQLISIEYADLLKLVKESHILACTIMNQMADCLRADNFVHVGDNQTQTKNNIDTDALTGLHSARWLRKKLAHELTRCVMDKTALVMIIFRIEQLSATEILYGQETKENILSSVAEALLNNSRGTDLLVHEDENTFITIRHDESASDAKAFVQRMIRVIGALDIIGPNGKILPAPYVKTVVFQQRQQEAVETIIANAKSRLASTPTGVKSKPSHTHIPATGKSLKRH